MKKEEILKKLTSRKFIISLAAFLGSIAVSISGIATSDHTITTIGVVCGILSAAFYSAAEAYVDAKAVGKDKDNE
jgi:drug/metabolite transporter (DMT)-like permease